MYNTYYSSASVGQCPRRFKSCSERCCFFFYLRCVRSIYCVLLYVMKYDDSCLQQIFFLLLWTTTLLQRARGAFIIIIDAKAHRSTGNSSCHFSLLNLCCIFDTTWYPDHDHRRHRSRRRTRSDAVAITKRWWCYYY